MSAVNSVIIQKQKAQFNTYWKQDIWEVYQLRVLPSAQTSAFVFWSWSWSWAGAALAPHTSPAVFF